MKRIRLVVPGQAPSKGNYRWSNSKSGRRRWARIKEFEKAVAEAAIEAKQKAKIRGIPKGRCTVDVVCHNQRADSDNIAKGAIDSLHGVCFRDDKDIWKRSHPQKDKEKGRVEVTVTWE